MAVISVEVLGGAPRAEELLAAVAQSLKIRPKRKGDRSALFWFSGMSTQDAWEALVDAVEAAGKDWADYLRLEVPPEFEERPYEPAAHLLCSFCGKPEPLVEKLIDGPGVYICDECVALCVEILEAEGGERSRPPDP